MGRCLVSTWATFMADKARVEVRGHWAGAAFLEPEAPTAPDFTPVPQEGRYVVRLSESNLVI